MCTDSEPGPCLYPGPGLTPKDHSLQAAADGPHPLPSSNRSSLRVLNWITGTFLWAQTALGKDFLGQPKPQPWPQGSSAALSIHVTLKTATLLVPKPVCHLGQSLQELPMGLSHR